MKNLLKLSALAAVLVVSATYASAASIQLGSFCSTCVAPSGDQNTGLILAGFQAEAPTVNSGTGVYTEGTNFGSVASFGTLTSSPTFNVSPGTVWSGPLSNSSWVSNQANGGPGVSGNPAQGFYLYETTFQATAATYNGTINLWADDTAAVILNGTPLIPFGTLGTDGDCAATAPTCVTPLETLNFSQLLLAGTNTLWIIDIQAGNESPGADPAGIDFNATLNTVPEPSTLLMLGTGLMGSAGALFRRMRK